MMALLLLCKACAADAIFGFALTWARPNKKIKNLNYYDTYFSKSKVLISTYPIRVVPEIFPDAA